jgi:hypothetical protein
MQTKTRKTVVAIFVVALVLGMGVTLKSKSLAQKSKGLAQERNSNPSGTPSEGFKLSAKAANSVVKQGEPILLKLSLKNITQSDLYIVETTSDQDYEIEVVNERGEYMSPTKRGQLLKGNPTLFTKVIGVKVAPGQERQVNIEVDQLHDMSARGTYTITAKRRVPKRGAGGTAEVISNKVQVKVN